MDAPASAPDGCTINAAICFLYLSNRVGYSDFRILHAALVDPPVANRSFAFSEDHAACMMMSIYPAVGTKQITNQCSLLQHKYSICSMYITSPEAAQVSQWMLKYGTQSSRA